jgi:hypothetical protein
MSFSSEVKEELSKQINYKDKLVLQAEFLGYILTGNSNVNSDKIEYVTENEFNIEAFYKILFNLQIDYEPSQKGKCYMAIIEFSKEIENFISLISSENENVLKTIVKGSFLGAGSVNDPTNKYHLEIIFNNEKNADYILNICKKFGINLKKMFSKGKTILYIKESEEISKFLALIGANKSVLNFEDIRIMHEMKNNVNRIVNCETANLNKTVNASVDQINDIKFIQEKNKFEEMSEDLKVIALARLENPDCTLKELGEKLAEPLGKSGVNHRMQRIHEFAEELKKM